MPKKIRPNQKVAQTVIQPPTEQPVMSGSVFATFLHEAQSIGNEVNARRRMQNEVGAYLAEKGLVADFEAWRAARASAPR